MNSPDCLTSCCPRCKRQFACGCRIPAGSGAACWCTTYPPLPVPALNVGCFCPTCLGELTGATESVVKAAESVSSV